MLGTLYLYYSLLYHLYNNGVRHTRVTGVVMARLKILSLCDGVGGGYMALKSLGVDFQYYAVEIDKHPRKIIDSMVNDIIRPVDDVKLLTREMLKALGPFDWVIFGSPCQSVSVASNGDGLDGKSGLLLDCLRVLKICQEYNPNLKFLIENVKMKNAFKEQFNELIGVEPVLINSALVSAQKRERYYWCNFPVSQPKDRGIVIPELVAWSRSTRYPKDKPSYVEMRETKNGKSNTLTTGMYCASFSSKTFSECHGGRAPLSVYQCLYLQTIPINYTSGFFQVSKSQAYKAIGNGWTIEVIKHIFSEGLK